MHTLCSAVKIDESKKDWQTELSQAITRPEDLAAILSVDGGEIENVTARYPMQIPRYYLSLITEKGDPIWRQAVPDKSEMQPTYAADPTLENRQSPLPGLVHRYPDRVLWKVTNRCAMYCRFCMRKRRVGRAGNPPLSISAGIDYIRRHRTIREVILSGGDPMLLSDTHLEKILSGLHQIAHVEILRIHTRTPCVLPLRITDDLVRMLRRFQPLWLQVHFNHPLEITEAAAAACARLADVGIPLGSQTVLLRGVNDNPDVLELLLRKLVSLRIRPYYLHHADPVRGTAHFRTAVQTGLDIMRNLRSRISGLCLPTYMIDLPDGGGKVPLLPGYIEKCEEHHLVVKNYEGKRYCYPL